MKGCVNAFRVKLKCVESVCTALIVSLPAVAVRPSTSNPPVPPLSVIPVGTTPVYVNCGLVSTTAPAVVTLKLPTPAAVGVKLN